jgi:hypothetical protein
MDAQHNGLRSGRRSRTGAPGMTTERSEPNGICPHTASHLRTLSVAPSIVASKTGDASTAWI